MMCPCFLLSLLFFPVPPNKCIQALEKEALLEDLGWAPAPVVLDLSREEGVIIRSVCHCCELVSSSVKWECCCWGVTWPLWDPCFLQY